MVCGTERAHLYRREKEGGEEGEMLTCPIPALNMIGFIHSLRSPLASLCPKVLVNPWGLGF